MTAALPEVRWDAYRLGEAMQCPVCGDEATFRDRGQWPIGRRTADDAGNPLTLYRRQCRRFVMVRWGSTREPDLCLETYTHGPALGWWQPGRWERPASDASGEST